MVKKLQKNQSSTIIVYAVWCLGFSQRIYPSAKAKAPSKNANYLKMSNYFFVKIEEGFS